ncbi:histone-lysine N-methyltransferase 2A-like isoform X2 [Haliotis asinina]|uniref:histone-lysine N-methyltransferase 2A-like isoform X2 n=1 Tax=Haliotis asinina TaxID=109174 RepID=UPI0035319B36
MARLRFPGRPGYRFDRLGVRYGADEARNVNDPSLAIVAYIHHGLRQFRELFGESDEEEDFDGFSAKDVRYGEKKLERTTSDLIKKLFNSDEETERTPAPRAKTIRLGRTRSSVDAPLSSDRTGGRIKAVVRKSCQELVKGGLSKTPKSHVMASVKEVERMKMPKEGRPKKIVRGKRFVIGQRKENVKFKKPALTVKLKNFDPSKSPRPRGRPPRVDKLLTETVNKQQEKVPRKVGRPRKTGIPVKEVRKKLPVKVVCVPKTKQTEKKRAKQLLEKAKKGRPVLQSRISQPMKPKSDPNVVHIPKPKKEFVLPTVSSRSSRVIIPNKRFIEEDGYYGKVWKKPKLDKSPDASLVSPKAKEEGSTKKMKVTPGNKVPKTPEKGVASEGKDKTPSRKKNSDNFASPDVVMSPILHPKGGNSVSLFSSVVAGKMKKDKSLIVEGKRQRKPSLKMRMRKGEIPRGMLLDMDESSSASQESSQGSSENSSKSVDLFPKSVSASAGVSVFSRAGPMSLGKGGQDTLAAKRSGDNILRKAKLQLNRVAVNRSKAALARSLKAQMKKEAKLQRQQLRKKSSFSPQSPTSPLALSPISGTRAFIDGPGSPPRPLFDNNNLPLSPDNEKSAKEKITPVKRGSHISPKVMSSLAAKLATSAQQEVDVVMEGEEQPPVEGATDSRGGGGSGPRIKHVCRRAAMVLRKPVAKFPSPPSLRLSALPSLEKEKMLEESKAQRERESSDDERPMEEIIRNAATQESHVIKKSPVKSHAATYPFTKTGRRRKVRCRQCKGCMAEDCGKCIYCLDKPKFGGRSVMKQACVERKCSNPKYAKVATTFVLKNIKSRDREPDDDSHTDGDGRHSFSSKSSHNSTGGNNGGRRLPMVQDGDGRSSNNSNTPPMSNASLHDGKKASLLSQARRIARAKEKAVTSLKTPGASLKPISTGSRRWMTSSADAHLLMADFRESCQVELAWQQGMALTMLAPACVRTVCYLCGSAGKHELIYCTACCEPFHLFCLDYEERPEEENMENWCCRRCQFCNVCGHQNHLLRCDRCQSTYHPECLGPSYPTRPSKKNIWVCTKCVRCKSCGATTPGTGTNATWTYDFSLCYECGKLMDKGNFCPICHKCYSDDDWESKMIQCVKCESWVHARCEQLSDEMYQLLSCLPEDVHYTCQICEKQRPAPWEKLLRAEFVASLKTVLLNLLSMKCAQHLLKRDDKKERKSAEKRKSSPKGKSSPAKSVTPVAMVTLSSTSEVLSSPQNLHVLSTPHSESELQAPGTTLAQTDGVLEQTNTDAMETNISIVPGSLSENPVTTICDSAVNCEKDTEEKISIETERNIFRIIDECLLSDKETTALCSDATKLDSQETSDLVKPVARDTVSMETNSCEKSDLRKEDVVSGKLEKLISDLPANDIMGTDDDQELLSYLKSYGESPERDTASKNDHSSQDQPESSLVLPSVPGSVLDKKDSLAEVEGNVSGETTLSASTPPMFVDTPDSSISMAVHVESVEKLADQQKSSDLESSASMQTLNNQTPTKSVSGSVTVTTPESSVGKKKYCDSRDFPTDFEAVRDKLETNLYHSVEEFSEDMVHIIQTALNNPEEQTHTRRKVNNSVRSVFVKQMEKCFPWFNINTCKLWEHNKSLPDGMLPDAVLPPSGDHTYAQWLEREDPPLSPQPSPFKRIQCSPIKKMVPMSSIDGDSETSSVVAMSDYGGDDLRQCLLCSSFGDDIPNEAGRLLYVGQDDWVHVNCALWSAEVFEEADGMLQNVHIAVGRGRQMRCDYCSRSGATVGCCNRGCSANYHFKCAKADHCMFQEDKKVYCKYHTTQVDGQLVEEDGFRVLRRVCIDTKGRYQKKTWNKGVHPSTLNILIGSCTIESLGYLGPLSDVKGCLLPIDFICTRVYWSTQDARRRCVYTCRIVEMRPNPASPEVKISDMRIIHDETHPEFIPMDQLSPDALSLLHMLSPTSNTNVSIMSETSVAQVTRRDLASTSVVRPCSRIYMASHNRSLSISPSQPSSSHLPSQQKEPELEPQPKFNLNLLSPNTLKYLSKADVEKYMASQPKQVPQKPADDEFGNLCKIVDRLNEAAWKSGKRADSADRTFRATSPPTMARTKRSSSCDIQPYTRDSPRPYQTISATPTPRPASVASMPIRVKVKSSPSLGPDQPIRISVTPHKTPPVVDLTHEPSDVIVLEDDENKVMGSTHDVPEGAERTGLETEASKLENEPSDLETDPLLLSPEQEIAQQVLDSVPPEILESNDGQTVVIMTDNPDISEEEALLLAQAALSEDAGVVQDEDTQGKEEQSECKEEGRDEGEMEIEDQKEQEPVGVEDAAVDEQVNEDVTMNNTPESGKEGQESKNLEMMEAPEDVEQKVVEAERKETDSEERVIELDASDILSDSETPVHEGKPSTEVTSKPDVTQVKSLADVASQNIAENPTNHNDTPVVSAKDNMTDVIQIPDKGVPDSSTLNLALSPMKHLVNIPGNPLESPIKASSMSPENPETNLENHESCPSGNIEASSSEILESTLPENLQPSPLKNFETSASGNLEATSRNSPNSPANLETSPSKNFEESSSKNLKASSSGNLETTASGNSPKSTSGNFETSPLKNLEESPSKNLGESPLKNLEESPVKNLEASPSNNLNTGHAKVPTASPSRNPARSPTGSPPTPGHKREATGVIDRKIIEHHEERVPIYKRGVLIGWKINLDDVMEDKKDVKEEIKEEVVSVEDIMEISQPRLSLCPETSHLAHLEEETSSGMKLPVTMTAPEGHKRVAAGNERLAKSTEHDTHVHDGDDTEPQYQVKGGVRVEDCAGEPTESGPLALEVAGEKMDISVEDVKVEQEWDAEFEESKLDAEDSSEEFAVKLEINKMSRYDSEIPDDACNKDTTEVHTRTSVKKGCAPLKTYPLRRTSQRLGDGGDTSRQPATEPVSEELPLHDKIARKIKAESLAKSSPGVKGPFKCLTCKRLYRTKESFNTHVQNCDFEVSTSEEDDDDNRLREEEEPKTRYPVRSRYRSVDSQDCIVKLTDISKATEFSKYNKTDQDDTTPVKRRPGRPPKNKNVVVKEKLPDVVDLCESGEEFKPDEPVRRGRSSKRLLSPPDSSESKKIVSPESQEPPHKRGRGRRSRRSDPLSPNKKGESENEMDNHQSPESRKANTEPTPTLVTPKRGRGRPKKQSTSMENMETGEDIGIKTPTNVRPQKDESLSPEFRLCEVTGMLKNKKGDVMEIPIPSPCKTDQLGTHTNEEKSTLDQKLTETTDSVENHSESVPKCSEPKSVSCDEFPQVQKTVFNNKAADEELPVSPHDVITDIDIEDPMDSSCVSDELRDIPAVSVEGMSAETASAVLKRDVSKVVEILEGKILPKPAEVRVNTQAVDHATHINKADGKQNVKKTDDKNVKRADVKTVEQGSRNITHGEFEVDIRRRKSRDEGSSEQCAHYMDKEKSTKQVQYYMVYPPNAKNIPEKDTCVRNDTEGRSDSGSHSADKRCEVPQESYKQRTHNTKPKNHVKISKSIAPATQQVSKCMPSTITNLLNAVGKSSAHPSIPQPLTIPSPGGDNSSIIGRTSAQQRNIFEAFQPQPSVNIIGSPPLAGVHASNVLENAVVQMNQSRMLPTTIQTTSQTVHPHIPQPLTINTSPQQSINTFSLDQGPNIIPNIPGILHRPALPSIINQINQPSIIHTNQTNILGTSLPPSPATLLQSNQTLGLLAQQQSPSNVIVPPSQQVLPPNLISQLGNLLPSQLTPQQASVVSRLNLQQQHQGGIEYMGSFLLDPKTPPQPYVSVSQASPVLTPSLTPQQTQQIMNLVSGSVLNKGTVVNQNVMQSTGVLHQPFPGPSHISPPPNPVINVVHSRADTILHSNLIRHLPDGCKTVVCSHSEALSMLKKILPSNKQTVNPAITTSPSITKVAVSSPNLRNILNDSPIKSGSVCSASLQESTVRPHHIVHKPSIGVHKPGTAVNSRLTVLKKILKPTILHRKKAASSITLTAVKHHLGLSPEKNGIIQGQISKNICNSLEDHMQQETSPSKTTTPTSHIAAGHTYTKVPTHIKHLSVSGGEQVPNFSSKMVKSRLGAKVKKSAIKVGKIYKKNMAVVKVGVKAVGAKKRKSPQRPRNIHEKYKPSAISHPMIHHQKEVMSLPQPEMEEEVRETPMMPFLDITNHRRRSEAKPKDEPRLMFEITSDDGFQCSGETMEDAWRQVTEKVQDARAAARLKALSYAGMNSASMFGVNNSTVVYLVEQLFGAQHCHKYNFHFFQHEVEQQEEEPAENPSGCVRGEPFMSRKPYDMFSFLMSRYRSKPMSDAGQQNVEMIHKSARRATSMDLPMAMRFRKLQEHAKEAVGVYRSHIHGRGLFCKRNIDSGEMVIEYAGEVIRSSLTDKREKYYESKGIGCYMFRIDDFEVVDATMHGSAARFINHSCEPNCYSRVINVDGKKHIVIFAMRPISKGEELTYDYKFPIEEVKIPCSCGSKKCRKYLN